MPFSLSSWPVRGAWPWIFALGLALCDCGGRTNGPIIAPNQDGGLESASISDALVAAVDAGLDATTAPEAETGHESGTVAEAEAAAIEASSTDGGGEAGLDAATGKDGSLGDAGNEAGSETGADAALPPSCAPGGPGMTNCGPGGSGTESCCTSLEVTGGTYYRTYTNSGSGPTGEADPATVSGFRMDKYLVTVGRFRQFVNAWDGGHGYTPPEGSGKHTHLNNGNGLNATGGGYEPGWVASDDVNVLPTNTNLSSGFCTWTPSASSDENVPINCVNWYEAYAFCIWDDGFLPSEAEWEYAAAGGGQQREYPWGSTDPGRASQYAIYGCNYPNGPEACDAVDSVTNIAPVGTATLGAGLWGHLDLAGELWEWNLDWYARYVDPCADCADLTDLTEARAIRGGYFDGAASLLLPPSHYPTFPPDRVSAIGFRCSRSP